MSERALPRSDMVLCRSERALSRSGRTYSGKNFGLQLRLHAHFIHQTLIGVMLNL